MLKIAKNANTKLYKDKTHFLIMSDETTLYTPKQLSELLNVSTETIRLWSIEGKIRTVVTKGGHRRYIYKQKTANDGLEKISYIYARVSSHKQQHDLERQIDFLKARYPNYVVVSDIGSGLNYKRRGFNTILDKLIDGLVAEVVVAYRDRFVRFGFDFMEHLFKRHGAVLRVHENKRFKDSISELHDDLLSIITVFTARYYGTRKYRNKESSLLPNKRANIASKQVLRSKSVLLQ
jgi:excisionase family DNA binding protein